MKKKKTPIGISITGKDMNTLSLLRLVKSNFPTATTSDHIYISHLANDTPDPEANTPTPLIKQEQNADNADPIYECLLAGRPADLQTFHKDSGLLIPFVSTGSFGNHRKKP